MLLQLILIPTQLLPDTGPSPLSILIQLPITNSFPDDAPHFHRSESRVYLFQILYGGHFVKSVAGSRCNHRCFCLN